MSSYDSEDIAQNQTDNTIISLIWYTSKSSVLGFSKFLESYEM